MSVGSAVLKSFFRAAIILCRCKFKVEWYDANSILQQTNETDWIPTGGAGSRFRQTFSKVLNSVNTWRVRVYVQNDFVGYREWGHYDTYVYTPIQIPSNVVASQGTFTDKVRITWTGGEGHRFSIRRCFTNNYSDYRFRVIPI